MAEYKKVRVIYKPYHGFKLQLEEHIVGNKTINRQRISGLKLYKDTLENIEKAKASNAKIDEIRKLQDEIYDIENSMERYTE